MLLALLVSTTLGATAPAVPVMAGPVEIRIAERASFRIPAGYSYIGAEEARRMVASWGDGSEASVHGIVVPAANRGDGFMIVRIAVQGFFAGASEHIAADALFARIREASAITNAHRARLGLPSTEVVGWHQEPVFDAVAGRLSWAIVTRETGSAGGRGEQQVNWTHLIPGREGYVAFVMVAALGALPRERASFDRIVASFAYAPGQRYADASGSANRARGGDVITLERIIAGEPRARTTPMPIIASALAAAAAAALFFAWRRRATASRPSDPRSS